MKNLFFIPILCLFSLCTIRHKISASQSTGISDPQKRYDDLQQARSKKWLPECISAHENLKRHPNDPAFQATFTEAEKMLAGCDKAILTRLAEIYPKSSRISVFRMRQPKDMVRKPFFHL